MTPAFAGGMLAVATSALCGLAPSQIADASSNAVHVVNKADQIKFFAPPGFAGVPATGNELIALVNSDTGAAIAVDDPRGLITTQDIVTFLDSVPSIEGGTLNILKEAHQTRPYGLLRSVTYSGTSPKLPNAFYGEDVRFLHQYRTYELLVQAFSPTEVASIVKIMLNTWGT